VATALKDFFKRFPSILTQDQMDEMEEISSKRSFFVGVWAYEDKFLTNYLPLQ